MVSWLSGNEVAVYDNLDEKKEEIWRRNTNYCAHVKTKIGELQSHSHDTRVSSQNMNIIHAHMYSAPRAPCW